MFIFLCNVIKRLGKITTITVYLRFLDTIHVCPSIVPTYPLISLYLHCRESYYITAYAGSWLGVIGVGYVTM